MDSSDYIRGIARPFGPPILKGRLDKSMIDLLNKQCDEVLENRKSREELDVSHLLSKAIKGNIQEELDCNLADDCHAPFRSLIFDSLYCLHSDFYQKNSVPTDKFSVTVESAWYVRSFAGNFNPVHRHFPAQPEDSNGIGGMMSCIAYLKIPKGITNKNAAGYIDFLYGVSNNLNRSSLLTKPELGDIYFFPSYLSHTVYPFKGEGERRSFASNIQIRKSEETK
tara:strand:- start:1047 stop:1718 length:672 start_codon:yes stop_codon:yes gene_type:complete